MSICKIFVRTLIALDPETSPSFLSYIYTPPPLNPSLFTSSPILLPQL